MTITDDEKVASGQHLEQGCRNYSAVVKRRQEKRRWTKRRRQHKVDMALKSQKVETEGRQG
jgi:hypothetical protein